MKVKVFGRLVEICKSDSIELESVQTVYQLKEYLENKFPALLNQKYLIAKNKKIISGNEEVSEDSELALMPPFSGG